MSQQLQKLNIVQTLDQYKFIKKLGEGTFGNVWEAENSKGEVCAVKMLKNAKATLSAQHYMELRAAKMLSHQNIVNTNNVFIYDGKLCLEQEFCTGSFDALVSRRLGIDERRIVYHQLLTGLEYLHSQRFVHRDLKPGNVLVKFQKDVNSTLEGKQTYIKIADFGLGTYVGKTPYGQFRRVHAGHCWTDGYRPPEVIFEYPDYGPPADVWSLGLIFLQITTKKLFFNVMVPNEQLSRVYQNFKLQKEQVTQIIFEDAEGGFPVFLNDEDMPEDEKQFIASMLQLNFRKRPSCAKLLQSDFMLKTEQNRLRMIGQDVLAPLDPLPANQFMSIEQLRANGIIGQIDE